MKTLYLECNMGASGDMLMGALLQLLPDPEVFLQRMSAMFGSAGVEVTLGEGEQCGIKGAHVTVKIHGEEEESQDVLIGGHTHDHDHTHHHHDHDHDHSHTYAQDHAHDHDHDHDHAHDHAHDHVHHHHHTNLHTIRHLLQHLPVSETVRQRAEGVYLAIAEAESHAHGKPVEKIHFHEVGAMDAVADIVAFAY